MAPYGFNHAVLATRRVTGAGVRTNARCPVCGSIDRERLLLHFLEHATQVLRTPTRLLHIAPETRLRARLKGCRTLTYFTADLVQPAADVRAELTRLPLADGVVDVVICSHVLEHVPDDHAALRDIYRVLRPGGWAALLVPISETLPRTLEDRAIVDPALREREFGQRDHVRLYARDFGTRVSSAGFVTDTFDWREKFGVPGRRLAFEPGRAHLPCGTSRLIELSNARIPDPC